MATFLMVPGARHGGWAFGRVKRRLEGAGHEVFAPSLTGLAERAHLVSPAVDLSFHVDDVVRVFESWDLHDVILAGHSYGGLVITGVADRIRGAIGTLVYLDAVTPENGKSLVDIGGAALTASRAHNVVLVDGVELFEPRHEAFYGVVDAADRAWMRARMTPHPWKCFEEKLWFDEAVLAGIPTHHVVSTRIPQREARHPDMVAKARADGRWWVIPGAHDVMITDPDAVTAVLERIAAAG